MDYLRRGCLRMRRPCTKVNMGEGGRAAAFLLTSCLVAFGVSLVDCEAPPAGVVEGLAGPLARDVSATDGRTPSATQGSERVTKREVREEGEPASECLEVEVLTNKTFQPVKIVRQLHYTFFLRPRPEFIDIKFNMMIDNLWNLALPYESSEAVVFSRADVEEEAERQAWVQITVEYFKHEVKNGRDKHGLRITVGNVTRQMISSRWWRTHAFEGFLVSARGPAKLLFDCPPQELVSPVPARLMNTPVLLGGILVLAFLVVVVPWMCFVYRRRANADLDEGPEVPPLPKSLVRVLLGILVDSLFPFLFSFLSTLLSLPKRFRSLCTITFIMALLTELRILRLMQILLIKMIPQLLLLPLLQHSYLD